MRAAQDKKFLTSTKREPAFLTKGFSYWKEATTAFNKHQASDCHREATAVNLPQQESDVCDVLSTKVKEQKVENRKMLLTIFQKKRVCARG